MVLTYLKYALGLASILLLILIALLLLFSPLPLKKGAAPAGSLDFNLPREVRQLDAQIHAGFFSLGISKEPSEPRRQVSLWVTVDGQHPTLGGGEAPKGLTMET